MLNRREKLVMNAVYTLCRNKQVCLVSPWEILNLLPPKQKFNEEKLDKILRELQMDDYFEMISSERKGEKMYVITLHPDGLAFKRSGVQEKRKIYNKLWLSLLGAAVAFVAGVLLRVIFKVG